MWECFVGAYLLGILWILREMYDILMIENVKPFLLGFQVGENAYPLWGGNPLMKILLCRISLLFVDKRQGVSCKIRFALL